MSERESKVEAVSFYDLVWKSCSIIPAGRCWGGQSWDCTLGIIWENRVGHTGAVLGEVLASPLDGDLLVIIFWLEGKDS